jgi:hypothetical protein
MYKTKKEKVNKKCGSSHQTLISETLDLSAEPCRVQNQKKVISYLKRENQLSDMVVYIIDL